MKNLYEIPEDLPVPSDDGACDHLVGRKFPDIDFHSTHSRLVNLSKISQPIVLFIYPKTGLPTAPTPQGWDLIPGARGCTPQSCSFRDHYAEFIQRGYEVFGLSTQDTEYQKEFVTRNHIPFEILTDEHLKLTEELNLPTFIYENLRLLKRMAMIIKSGVIEKVFYPVFPPQKNAETVLAWINHLS